MVESTLIEIIYKCGVVMLLTLFLGAMSFGGFMLWKILSIIRYIEFNSARMSYPMMPANPGIGMPGISPSPPGDKDGSFVPYSESDAYINEEMNNISNVSNDEAINVIMEKIRRQELAKKGNGAEV